MTVTLVGEHLLLEKRAHAIGWLFTGTALPYIIGPPLIGFIVELGGWRWTFMAFAFPSALLSLGLVIGGVIRLVMKNNDIKHSYRSIARRIILRVRSVM